ncbi:MAG: hypothetical protein ACYTDY_01810, partial [Planctomycetota bacterium]
MLLGSLVERGTLPRGEPAAPADATPPVRATEPPTGVLPPAAAVQQTARLPDRRIVFSGAAPREGELPDVCRLLLEESRGRIGLDAVPGELRKKREFGSLSGWHLRYEQVVGGVPVHGSEVSVHVAPDGRPLLVNADVYPVSGVDTRPAVDEPAARSSAVDLVGEPEDPEVVTKPGRLAILPEGRSGRLVWIVDAWTPEASARVFVDAHTGATARVEDLRHYAEGVARIYDPNPVYMLGAATVNDNGDRDS